MTPPPVLYWVFWSILAVLIILLMKYIIETRRHEEHGHKKSIYDGLTFAGIVSALALGAFAITFSSEFYKYAKYYEHPAIGVIRFIVMAITALLLMHYAVKGRHDH
ncbi:MAG: hypothetical protein BME93_05840 [Methanosarcinales archaeon Met12]|nr:MAG: hypothetical protein BME93_05840 [Methanosarcinales archaeon Met12]